MNGVWIGLGIFLGVPILLWLVLCAAGLVVELLKALAMIPIALIALVIELPRMPRKLWKKALEVPRIVLEEELWKPILIFVFVFLSLAVACWRDIGHF